MSAREVPNHAGLREKGLASVCGVLTGQVHNVRTMRSTAVGIVFLVYSLCFLRILCTEREHHPVGGVLVGPRRGLLGAHGGFVPSITTPCCMPSRTHPRSDHSNVHVLTLPEHPAHIACSREALLTILPACSRAWPSLVLQGTHQGVQSTHTPPSLSSARLRTRNRATTTCAP